MFAKKLYTAAFNLSLFFGGLAALLSALSVYNRLLMILGLLFGFMGFGLCCLHIVIGQREEEEIKLSSTPMLLLSLFLNSTPLLCMILLILMVKHGS